MLTVLGAILTISSFTILGMLVDGSVSTWYGIFAGIGIWAGTWAIVLD